MTSDFLPEYNAVPIVLGIAAWHEEKAAQRAAEQEQALGAIIIKGLAVKVERRQRA